MSNMSNNLPNDNYKKHRGLNYDYDSKQNIPNKPKIVPYSPFGGIHSGKNNAYNANYINNYNDHRLAAISHIKQMNPKHKNLIIPVLPDSINKY